MSYEDKLIAWIGMLAGLFIIGGITLGIYLYERKYHPNPKSTHDIIEKPKAKFFEAKALSKRVHIYYASQINIPKSIAEYFITFLLETGEEREYSVSQEMYEKTEEGQEATLVLLNDKFFDFGEGENIDEIEE